MSPQVERPLPPYEQIAQYYRDKIKSGELVDGDRLPSIRQIAEEWNVAHATASKVLRALAAEGLVKILPGSGGTLVADSQLGYSPRDRLTSIRGAGRVYLAGEYARIVSAELVPATESVADAIGLEPGAMVIRRHRVTFRADGVPVSASTSWFDGALAEVAPLLLVAERIKQGTSGYIEERTGRRAHSGRDQFTAGLADATVAEELGVPEGSPVLVGRNWYRDADGEAIEYGEYISHPSRWQTYEYEMT